MHEMIADRTIMVDTTGAVVGLNGLAVLDLGDYTFGRPNRITAATYQGHRGVINIGTKPRMSGRTHDKGVLRSSPASLGAATPRTSRSACPPASPSSSRTTGSST